MPTPPSPSCLTVNPGSGNRAGRNLPRWKEASQRDEPSRHDGRSRAREPRHKARCPGRASHEWKWSAAPIMYSHSSAHSLCPHPRNVHDDILKLVKRKNRGVIVKFTPDFISCITKPAKKTGMPDYDSKNNTLKHVVEHIAHIRNLIKYNHAGLGSDFDGIQNTPKGFDNVSKFSDLVAEMLRKGVSEEDTSKAVGGNILRVWRDVDAVALKI